MKIRQTHFARLIGISQGHLSDILSTKKRPSWKLAKKLAAATSTDPVLWLEGTPEQIKAVLTTDSDEDDESESVCQEKAA
jgi:transcriptional regulator with XRE-family HTH domain